MPCRRVAFQDPKCIVHKVLAGQELGVQARGRLQVQVQVQVDCWRTAGKGTAWWTLVRGGAAWECGWSVLERQAPYEAGPEHCTA